MCQRCYVEQVAEKIKIPWPDWPGRCHEIAYRCLKSGVVKGKLRFGNWLGEIAAHSHFQGRPFSHHGWVVLADGQIWDPTQWAFLGYFSYIYVGPSDERYDSGGNALRKLLRRPPQKTGRRIKIDGLDVVKWFGRRKALYLGELGWLANLSPEELGNARKMYSWLKRSGFQSWVPVDNWTMVMEEGK
jgi:hypothetical protein